MTDNLDINNANPSRALEAMFILFPLLITTALLDIL